MRSCNLLIDGAMIRSNGNELLQASGPTGEIPDGWVLRRKKRHGISAAKLSGESGSVDMEVVVSWRTSVLKTSIENFDPENIFNADETEGYSGSYSQQNSTLQG